MAVLQQCTLQRREGAGLTPTRCCRYGATRQKMMHSVRTADATHRSMLLRISAFFASSDDIAAAEGEDVSAVGVSATAGDDCRVVAAFWSSESTASTAAAILFFSLVALLEQTSYDMFKNPGHHKTKIAEQRTRRTLRGEEFHSKANKHK